MAENKDPDEQIEEEPAGQPVSGAPESEATAGGDSGESDGETRRTSSRLWTPYSDPRSPEAGTMGEETAEEEISEEEYRRLVEEALERITVAEVVLDVMVSLASLAYKKMGIPHEVNEQFKDMEQARLAIDCIDVLVQTLGGRVPEEALQPFIGTIDNLKLNFVKES